MAQRLYMLSIGVILLTALYFDLSPLIYALVALMVFEGLTGLRIAGLFPCKRQMDPSPWEQNRAIRFDFPAERVWQLMVGVVVVISYGLFYTEMWFFPWFVGLAVAGAGLSGVCPLLISLKAVGFK